MTTVPDYNAMLKVAVEEARQGLAEGGIPIGAALFTRGGELLGAGHNRRFQENDPCVHAETDAFRKAGRQPSNDRRLWAILRGRFFRWTSRQLQQMSFSTQSAKSGRSLDHHKQLSPPRRLCENSYWTRFSEIGNANRPLG